MNTRVLLAFAAVVAIAVAFAGTAQATTLPVANYSFEANTVALGQTKTLHTDWTYQAQGGGTPSDLVTWHPTTADFPTIPDGVNVIYNNQYAGGIAMTNTIPVGTLDEGQTYTITVAVGTPIISPANGGQTPYQQYAILGFTDLTQGAQASGDSAFAGNPTPGTWQDVSVSVTGEQLALAVSGATGDPDPSDFYGDTLGLFIDFGSQTAIDNVRITEVPTVVPSRRRWRCWLRA